VLKESLSVDFFSHGLLTKFVCVCSESVEVMDVD
jgi:hypothetical protein